MNKKRNSGFHLKRDIWNLLNDDNNGNVVANAKWLDPPPPH